MAAEELAISIAEVTASDDGKSVTFRVTSELRNGEAKVKSVSRTYAQFVALQGKIADTFKSKLVPVLPEPPNASMVSDADHMEKKRRQFDRFMSRLANRAEFASHPELRAFLSSASFDEEKKPNAMSALLGLVNSKTDNNGFRTFKPSLEVDVEDEADADKRRLQVVQSEREHKAVLDAVANVVRARAALGRQLGVLCSSLGEIDFGKTAFAAASKDGIEFGASLANLHHEQTKEEIFHFGDVFLEKKTHANAFRALINGRTELVASIEGAIKAQQKTAAALEATRKKHGDASAEMIKAIDEDDKAKEHIKALKEHYVVFKADMRNEFTAYAQDKLVDYQMALDHYVRTQLNSEQEKLSLLEDFHRKLVTAAP